ncbi:MAG: hypothetical protein ABL907_00740 [Hyphomicrobium sp.]
MRRTRKRIAEDIQKRRRDSHYEGEERGSDFFARTTIQEVFAALFAVFGIIATIASGIMSVVSLISYLSENRAISDLWSTFRDIWTHLPDILSHALNMLERWFGIVLDYYRKYAYAFIENVLAVLPWRFSIADWAKDLIFVSAFSFLYGLRIEIYHKVIEQLEANLFLYDSSAWVRVFSFISYVALQIIVLPLGLVSAIAVFWASAVLYCISFGRILPHKFGMLWSKLGSYIVMYPLSFATLFGALSLLDHIYGLSK